MHVGYPRGVCLQAEHLALWKQSRAMLLHRASGCASMARSAPKSGAGAAAPPIASPTTACEDCEPHRMGQLGGGTLT